MMLVEMFHFFAAFWLSDFDRNFFLLWYMDRLIVTIPHLCLNPLMWREKALYFHLQFSNHEFILGRRVCSLHSLFFGSCEWSLRKMSILSDFSFSVKASLGSLEESESKVFRFLWLKCVMRASEKCWCQFAFCLVLEVKFFPEWIMSTNISLITERLLTTRFVSLDTGKFPYCPD